MKEIKTKPEGGKPKLLDKAAKAPKTAMKDLWLKSKDKSISELKETPFASQRGECISSGAGTSKKEKSTPWTEKGNPDLYFLQNVGVQRVWKHILQAGNQSRNCSMGLLSAFP